MNTIAHKLLLDDFQAKSKLGDAMREAIFSVAEARYVTGRINVNTIILQDASTAQYKVRTKRENVAGISLDYQRV